MWLSIPMLRMPATRSWTLIRKRPCFSSWLWIVLCHNEGDFLLAGIVPAQDTKGSGSHMGGRVIELAVFGAIVAGAITAGAAAAETHKELRFNLGPRAGVSVNNPYGSISVKPSTGNAVIVNAVLASDKVDVDNNVVAHRVEIQSH